MKRISRNTSEEKKKKKSSSSYSLRSSVCRIVPVTFKLHEFDVNEYCSMYWRENEWNNFKVKKKKKLFSIDVLSPHSLCRIILIALNECTRAILEFNSNKLIVFCWSAENGQGYTYPSIHPSYVFSAQTNSINNDCEKNSNAQNKKMKLIRVHFRHSLYAFCVVHGFVHRH